MTQVSRAPAPSNRVRLTRRLVAELAAYADGTLDAARAETIAARVAVSAQLEELVAHQRRAIEAVRELVADQAASPGLRAAIESRRAAHSARRVLPRLPRLAVTSLGALTAVVTAIAIGVIAFAGGGGGGPTVAQVAALALRGPVAAAPAQSRRQPELLARAVDGASYPDWAYVFGWRASGMRTDRIAGRKAVTVFYASASREQVAYTIVPGSALSRPAGVATVRAGLRFVPLLRGDQAIVTWQRGGHTCVLSGRGLRVATLIELAAWRDRGAVTA